MRNRVSGDTCAMVWPHAGAAPHVTQRATCGAPDTRLLQLYTCRVALAASVAEKKLNIEKFVDIDYILVLDHIMYCLRLCFNDAIRGRDR